MYEDLCDYHKARKGLQSEDVDHSASDSDALSCDGSDMHASLFLSCSQDVTRSSWRLQALHESKWSQDKILECCTQLGNVFKRLGEQFLSMSIAISVVMTSKRPLYSSELRAGTGLYVHMLQRYSHIEELLPSGTSCDWVSSMDGIFLQKDCGEVSFADPIISSFLSDFLLSGIDRSHETLATACALQVRVDDSNEDIPTSKYRNSAFSGYAKDSCGYYHRRSRDNTRRHNGTKTKLAFRLPGVDHYPTNASFAPREMELYDDEG